MTVILVLLCLTVAGLELYMALGRRRQPPDAGRISGLEAANAGLTQRLAAAERHAEEQEAVITALRRAQDGLTALPERTETLADGLVRLEEGSGRQEVRLRLLEERDGNTALHEQVVQLDHLARALETNVSALRDQMRDLMPRLDALEFENDSTASRLTVSEQDLSARLAALEALGDIASRLAVVEDAADRLTTLERELAAAKIHARLIALETETLATGERLSGVESYMRASGARLEAVEEDVATAGERLETMPSTISSAVQGGTEDIASSLESMEGIVGRVHARIQEQLDREVTETLGGEPADAGTLLGALSGDLAPMEETLVLLYASLMEQHGLRVRLQVAEPEGTRYYLACPAGRGPVELEWEFLSMLDTLRSVSRPETPTPEMSALQSLLVAMNALGKGFIQLGPLVVVRTPDLLLCGVLSVGESRCFDTERMMIDIENAADRVRALPISRFHDLTTWAGAVGD